MAGFKDYTPSGYPKPEVCPSLGEEFDKMLADPLVQANIAEADSLFKNFTAFMRKKFPMEEPKR